MSICVLTRFIHSAFEFSSNNRHAQITPKMKVQFVLLAIFAILVQQTSENRREPNPDVENSNQSDTKKFERQGIAQPDPKWRLIFNPCGATCGGSYHRSRVICMKGELRIDESECPSEGRPLETVAPCGQQPCFSPRWKPFSYSDCTVTCGREVQVLQVLKCYILAVDEKNNNIHLEVAERMCNAIARPIITPIPCQVPLCPSVVAKVDVGTTNSETPTTRNNSAKRQSAVESTALLCLASLAALIRIHLFDT